MTRSDEDDAPKADLNAQADDFQTERDGSNMNKTMSSGDPELPVDGLESASKGSNQSKVLGVFAKIQPTGSPITACTKPFSRGYHNYFIGDIGDAGTLGIAFIAFNMFVPRYLEGMLARQKSMDLGLRGSLRFRVLSGMVKGSYVAASWLALAASCSMAGIDIRVSSDEFVKSLFFTDSRRSQDYVDGRDESVAEKYTRIGFLAGFPMAYAIFRDGWSVPAMHRTIPHLLPLNRLPLYVGFACMSAGALNMLNLQNFRHEQRPVAQHRDNT